MRDDLFDAGLVVGIGNPGMDYAEGAGPFDPAVFGSVVDVAVDAEEGFVHVFDEHA